MLVGGGLLLARFGIPGVKEIVDSFGGTKKFALLGLIGAMIFTGALGSFAQYTDSANTVPSSDGGIVLKSITLSNGIVNGSGTQETSKDYFNADKDIVTYYMNDADLGDDYYYNYSAKLTRLNTKNAGSVEVRCTSKDFSKSGTHYNIVSKDTNDAIEMDINGENDCSGETCSGIADFAEGTSSATIVIAIKHDEAGEDQLVVKDAKTVSCVADGLSWKSIYVAND